MTRKETLNEAEDCVLRSRQTTHGTPESSFGLIASFWSGYLGVPVQDYDVAIMMGLLKIARMKHNAVYADNFVDGVGYLCCAAELATEPRVIPLTEKDSPEC